MNTVLLPTTSVVYYSIPETIWLHIILWIAVTSLFSYVSSWNIVQFFSFCKLCKYYLHTKPPSNYSQTQLRLLLFANETLISATCIVGLMSVFRIYLPVWMAKRLRFQLPRLWTFDSCFSLIYIYLYLFNDCYSMLILLWTNSSTVNGFL